MQQIYGLIVAAGSGSRFGGQIPKQYQQVLGKSILAHSVARLNTPDVLDLTLVLAADDDFIDKTPLEFWSSIHRTTGGRERWQSVWAGVRAIRARGAKDDDWVLIHDAARPCLPMQDLQNILHYTGDAQGVILASPVVDTLKFAQDNHIVRTIDREHLWQALTPQMFRLQVLEQVLDFVQQHNLSITDEASALEQMGKPVAIIQGSKMNMKLTYADDLVLIEAILARYFLDV
ncbi:2-C-methyl-D-erythritol 4-phosphate cytidylyltransferase [Moraxella nasicaprae]|uniref:2-C-methyl-D-erythritol 4-phosphate cytidylyltransferase n=1 Tax=Moraxella nasicaprae TaxID=2904122 RepID=A0ABY6F5F9_9GAMM|nr:2-C-methyl-D-erythritol 4-phosphate cytidylyltransferase [Moraxella nasicaprae]UXZ05337.1 2-C-methyl-D-erythritol 4-phosphate cytidylyltransferase [Moraxella nasicaprae]